MHDREQISMPSTCINRTCNHAIKHAIKQVWRQSKDNLKQANLIFALYSLHICKRIDIIPLVFNQSINQPYSLHLCKRINIIPLVFLKSRVGPAMYLSCARLQTDRHRMAIRDGDQMEIRWSSYGAQMELRWRSGGDQVEIRWRSGGNQIVVRGEDGGRVEWFRNGWG